MNDLEHEIRLRILRIVATGDQTLSQRKLARQLGISLGKTNYCLNALAQKGWIRIQRFKNSRDKLRFAYILTPQGIQARIRLTKDFLSRKMREYDQIQQEIALLEQEIIGFQELVN